MRLYKISQSFNTDWYTYDSAVVVAETKEAARRIMPSPFYIYDDKAFYYQYKNQEPAREQNDPSWCHPKHVKVEELGTTIRKSGEVVVASMRGGIDESRAIDIARTRGALMAGLKGDQLARVVDAAADYGAQIKDTWLSFLRYHLIEANRNRDVPKVLEYERKLKDYMNQEYEDWS
jgi:hypothetical protein